MIFVFKFSIVNCNTLSWTIIIPFEWSISFHVSQFRLEKKWPEICIKLTFYEIKAIRFNIIEIKLGFKCTINAIVQREL